MYSCFTQTQKENRFTEMSTLPKKKKQNTEVQVK